MPNAVCTLCAVAGVVALLNAQEDAQAARPHGWFATTVVDLGRHLEGSAVDAIFAFRNGSDGRQEISNVKLNCSCAAAVIAVGEVRYRVSADGMERVTGDGDADRERVPAVPVGPGESGEVTITIDLRGAGGAKDAALTMLTTDPAMPVAGLRCRATVQSLFQVDPPEVVLGQMEPGDRREFTVKVTSPVQPDFELALDGALPPAMEVALQKEVADRKATWHLSGSYGPGLTPSSVGGVLILKSTVHDRALGVRVIAAVEPPIEVKPSNLLSFGVVRGKRGATRSVVLRPRDDLDLVIESVEAAGFSLPAEFVTTRVVEDGRARRIEIRVEPGAPPEALLGRVTVTTNHPLMREIVLLARGMVR